MHHKLQQHIPMQPTEDCNFTALARHSNQFLRQSKFWNELLHASEWFVTLQRMLSSVRRPVVLSLWALKVSDRPVVFLHFLSSRIYSVYPPGRWMDKEYHNSSQCSSTSSQEAALFLFVCFYPQAGLMHGATCLNHPRS